MEERPARARAPRGAPAKKSRDRHQAEWLAAAKQTLLRQTADLLCSWLKQKKGGFDWMRLQEFCPEVFVAASSRHEVALGLAARHCPQAARKMLLLGADATQVPLWAAPPPLLAAVESGTEEAVFLFGELLAGGADPAAIQSTSGRAPAPHARSLLACLIAGSETDFLDELEATPGFDWLVWPDPEFGGGALPAGDYARALGARGLGAVLDESARWRGLRAAWAGAVLRSSRRRRVQAPGT